MSRPQNKDGTGRDAKGRLLPGVSGNPGGRPKVLEEVREAARAHTPLALRTLVRLTKRADKDAVRVAAAEKLLEWAWGKPAQAVQVQGHDGGPLEALKGMTEAQLLAALAVLEASK